MERHGLIARTEIKLAQFRHLVYNNTNFLGGVSSVTILFSLVGLGMVASEEYGREIWWPSAVALCLLALAVYVSSLGIYVFDRHIVITRVRVRYPNLLSLRKATGKVFALALFTILDATLKNRNGRPVVLFCSSFYMHLVHLMVIFQLKEDCDFAEGFLAASFGLLYEMGTWWHVIPLMIITSIFFVLQNLTDRRNRGYRPRLRKFRVTG